MTDRARARFNPDKMASYSASLLEAGKPSRMACSRCSPVGDYSRSPTPDPDDREAPSTRKVHHSFSVDSCRWLGFREYSSTKSTITWPFMDNLGWNSIPNSLNSIAHCSILLVKSGLCRMLRRGWSVSTTTRVGLEIGAELLGDTSKN